KDRIDAEQRKIEEAYFDANGKKYPSLKSRIDSLQKTTEESIEDGEIEISKLWSEIKLIPGRITLEVGKLEQNVDEYIQLLQSQIDMTPEQIQLKVSELKEYVDGELFESYSKIDLLSDRIEMKVNVDG